MKLAESSRTNALKICTLICLALITSVLMSSSIPFLNHRGYVLIMSDTHYPPSSRRVDSIIEDTQNLKPRHVFILGDLTEMGKDSEFEAFERLKRKIETTIATCSVLFGNHDVRWSHRVRKDVNIEGGLYRVFEVQLDDIVFIGLDTSLFFEHLGHIGPAQLRWLRKRLETHNDVTREGSARKTVVLLTHHPIPYTDDGWKVYRASSEYNIAAVVSGHVHRFSFGGPINGMYTVTVGAAKDGFFAILSWDENHIYVWKPEGNRTYSLLGRINKNFSERQKISKTHERSSISQNDVLRHLWNFSASNTCYAPPVQVPGGYAVADYSGNVYLIDHTGKPYWSTKTSPVISNLALSDRILYVGDLHGNLVAVDTTERSVARQMKLEEPIFSISVGGATLGIGAGSKFYVLDSRTLNVLASMDVGGAVQKPATYDSGRYLFTSWGGKLHVLGENREFVSVAVGQTYYTAAGCSPVLSNGTIIFTHFSGYVGAISLQTGTELWRTTISGVGFSDVTVIDGHGYVSTIDGQVVKLELSSGKVVWRTSVGSPIFGASPVRIGSHVIVGTTRGELVLIDQSTGQISLMHKAFDSFLVRKPLVVGNLVIVAALDGTIGAYRVFLQKR